MSYFNNHNQYGRHQTDDTSASSQHTSSQDATESYCPHSNKHPPVANSQGDAWYDPSDTSRFSERPDSQNSILDGTGYPAHDAMGQTPINNERTTFGRSEPQIMASQTPGYQLSNNQTTSFDHTTYQTQDQTQAHYHDRSTSQLTFVFYDGPAKLGRYVACVSCSKARRKCVRPHVEHLEPCEWCITQGIHCETVKKSKKKKNGNSPDGGD